MQRHGNARFTTVPLKALSELVWIRSIFLFVKTVYFSLKKWFEYFLKIRSNGEMIRIKTFWSDYDFNGFQGLMYILCFLFLFTPKVGIIVFLTPVCFFQIKHLIAELVKVSTAEAEKLPKFHSKVLISEYLKFLDSKKINCF